MINLFRYYPWSIIFFISFGLCYGNHNHKWMLSTGLSNFTYNMWNNNTLNNEEFKQFVSLGYGRIDLNGIESGFGLTYSKDIWHPLSNGVYVRHRNYINHKILFNMNLMSFLHKSIIDKGIFKLKAGFKSYFNLGSPHNSMALGPTVGISVKGFYLEYFKGCMDLVDYSLYTDEVSLGINIRVKNND